MAFVEIDSHLSFEKETHRFQIDGRFVPSVTGILRGCGLIDDTYFSEFYARRGQLIHLTCQLFDENDLDEETLDPVLAGYLEGWKKFKADTGFESTNIEEPVYRTDLCYAGILDRTGTLNGESVVLDLKSGAIAPFTAIQLSLYQAALVPMPRKRIAVNITQEGTYKIQEFKDRRDWDTAKACLAIYHWKIKNNIS